MCLQNLYCPLIQKLNFFKELKCVLIKFGFFYFLALSDCAPNINHVLEWCIKDIQQQQSVIYLVHDQGYKGACSRRLRQETWTVYERRISNRANNKRQT